MWNYALKFSLSVDFKNCFERFLLCTKYFFLQERNAAVFILLSINPVWKMLNVKNTCTSALYRIHCNGTFYNGTVLTF